MSFFYSDGFLSGSQIRIMNVEALNLYPEFGPTSDVCGLYSMFYAEIPSHSYCPSTFGLTIPSTIFPWSCSSLRMGLGISNPSRTLA